MIELHGDVIIQHLAGLILSESLRLKLMPKFTSDRILITTMKVTENKAASLSKLQRGLSLIYVQ